MNTCVNLEELKKFKRVFKRNEIMVLKFGLKNLLQFTIFQNFSDICSVIFLFNEVINF